MNTCFRALPPLFALLIGILVLPGRSDGFRNPPAGAAAQGHIGGRIAYTPDASAVTHNPANLVEFDTYELQAGVTFGYSSMEFTGRSGAEVRSEDPWAVLPSLFAVYPATEENPVASRPR